MTKIFPLIFLLALVFSGLTVFGAITVSPVTAETYGSLSMGSSYMGGSLDDAGYCIKLTSGNGLIFAGYTKSFGAGGSDMWLLNTAPATYTMDNGVTGAYQREQWNMTYGGAKDDGAYSVIQTADGGYAATGFTSSYGAGANDMWLVKTDTNGKMQWNKTYGGPKDDAATCLTQTMDGGYLLAGYTNSSVPTQSSYIVKTDAIGNIIWSKTLSGNSANSVINTKDGGYALAIQYPNAFGLIQIDSSGNTMLSKTYAAPSNQASAQAIVQANDGGYAIAGWTDDSTGARGTWLVKTDGSGQEQWSKNYPDLGAYALIKTMKGGYAITGDRAFLIITDSSGNVEWNKVYDGQTGNGSKYFTRMQSLIEASPNHFVMVGIHDTPYVHMQLNWIQVALKSGSEMIPPETTILSPANGTTFSERDVPLTFYVNERTSHLMASVNSLNFSISGNTTLTNLPNGEYRVTVLSTDTDYNTGASQTVFFSVDSADPYVLPKVTIQSPISQTYNTTQIRLNFTVDQQVLWAVYSIDGGANRTTFPNTNTILNAPSIGTHTITVYAGDTAGGPAGSATVTFNVSIPIAPTPHILPYPPADANRNQISQVLGAAVQMALSNAVWIVMAIVFAVVISVVIVVLVITRKTPSAKENATLP